MRKILAVLFILLPMPCWATSSDTSLDNLFNITSTTASSYSPYRSTAGAWSSKQAYTPNFPFVYNTGNSNLSKLQAGFNKVKANTGNARLIILGTSSAGGFCSTYNAWLWTNTLEYQMAAYLTGVYGINTNNDSMFGYPVSDGTGRVTQDARLVVGGSWSEDTTYSIGGPMFTATTSTNTIDFTMPATADKVILWYPIDTTLGTISYAINGGAYTNISENGTAALGSTTVTITPGSNTIHIKQVSGTAKFIGVEPYLSTSASLNIINSGVGGIVAGGWDFSAGAKPYATPQVLTNYVADGLVILMNNNDAIAATATATYSSNMQKLITAQTGDTVLLSQVPPGASQLNPQSLGDPYITVLKTLSSTNSIPFFDNWTRAGSYLKYANNGMACNDDLHMNKQGYSDTMKYLTDGIMALSGSIPNTNGVVSPNIGGRGIISTATMPEPFSLGLGVNALLYEDPSSLYNVALGYNAGGAITTGTRNTVVGYNALNGNVFSTAVTGSQNAAFGTGTLGNLTTGSSNVAFGRLAGSSITTGSTNTIIGEEVASTTLSTGSGNIFIGVSSILDATASGDSNTFKLGNNAAPVISATAINTATPPVTISGTLTVQTGGSTNHGVCWKTGGMLGFCSTVLDSGGSCTCN